MKLISAAAIVFCGTLLLIASSRNETYNRESLFNLGVGIVIVGLGGWIISLRAEK
jgi:hypothetical protein